MKVRRKKESSADGVTQLLPGSLIIWFLMRSNRLVFWLKEGRCISVNRHILVVSTWLLCRVLCKCGKRLCSTFLLKNDLISIISSFSLLHVSDGFREKAHDGSAFFPPPCFSLTYFPSTAVKHIVNNLILTIFLKMGLNVILLLLGALLIVPRPFGSGYFSLFISNYYLVKLSSSICK